MGVLALMYHRTPQDSDHLLDVSMANFRAHVHALQDAGIRFIRFGEAMNHHWYGAETVVSITFDDGHASNIQALEFLHNAGLPATSFFVSGYVRDGQHGFMDTAACRSVSTICEVGSHGATHTGLSLLPPNALKEELNSSKSYLEQLCGRQLTTLSAPGGAINRRVVNAAQIAGFAVVGDSESMLNMSPKLPLHRVCIQKTHTPEFVVSLARAGSLHWYGKRLRRAAVLMAARSLSPGQFEAIRRAFGRKDY